MLCQPCAAQTPRGSMPRRSATASPVQLCEQCGAAIVTLRGVPLGVGNATLAHLARFGLAVTGEPLLELKRGGI